MKNKFLTSYGRVLLFVYEKSVFVNNEYLIPLTQTEICKETGINKTTINNLFIEYREDNFIYAEKRRYYLTKEAVEIAKFLEKIKEK